MTARAVTAAPVAIVGLHGGAWYGPPRRTALRDADLLVGSARQHEDLVPAALPGTPVELCGAGSTSSRSCAPSVPPKGRGSACSRPVIPASSASCGCSPPGSVTAASHVHPAPSSITLAFARVGLPWDDAVIATCHGRPIEPAAVAVADHHKVAVLVSRDSPPEALGRAIARRRQSAAGRVGVQPPGRSRRVGHAHRPRRPGGRAVRPVVGRGVRRRRDSASPRRAATGWGRGRGRLRTPTPVSSPRPRCAPSCSASSRYRRRACCGTSARAAGASASKRPDSSPGCGCSPSSATATRRRRSMPTPSDRRRWSSTTRRPEAFARAARSRPALRRRRRSEVLDAALERLRPGATAVADVRDARTGAGRGRAAGIARAAAGEPGRADRRRWPTCACAPRTRCSSRGARRDPRSGAHRVDHRGGRASSPIGCRTSTRTASWRDTVRDDVGRASTRFVLVLRHRCRRACRRSAARDKNAIRRWCASTRPGASPSPCAEATAPAPTTSPVMSPRCSAPTPSSRRRPTRSACRRSTTLPGFVAAGDIAGVARAWLDGRPPLVERTLEWPVPFAGGDGPSRVCSSPTEPSLLLADLWSCIRRRCGRGRRVDRRAGVRAHRRCSTRRSSTSRARARAVASVATIDRRAADAVVTALGLPGPGLRRCHLGQRRRAQPERRSSRPKSARRASPKRPRSPPPGAGAELVVAKRKAATVTCGDRPAGRDPRARSRWSGSDLDIPAIARVAAVAAIRRADVVIGYEPLRRPVRRPPSADSGRDPASRSVPRPIAAATPCAGLGRRARRVPVCSGDPGVFAMAGLVHELAPTIGSPPVEVVPGVTAASAAARARSARRSAHDHAFISLSDLLTPWAVIERACARSAATDLAVALYNPAIAVAGRGSSTGRARSSSSRRSAMPRRSASSPTRPGPSEQWSVTTLDGLDRDGVGMLSIVVVGRRRTSFEPDGRIVTPRGYGL